MSDPDRLPREARRRLLRALAKDLGHEFTDLEHLDRALTHASTGNDDRPNYERLEFLGDAFLNFAVADALFQQQPEIPEGKLTETRAALVSRKPLAQVARRLNLVAYLDVGKGLREGDLRSERILADLVEAVLGAIYIDGGVRAARAFVKQHLLAHADEVAVAPEGTIDSKTQLLHFCQRHKLGQPRYELIEAHGRQHEQEFQVEARLQDGRKAAGTGSNKRSAEKVAAAALLLKLRTEGRPAEA
jgi:ribonuclease-3